MLHYFLKNADENQEVKLEILEPDGDLIRSFSSKTMEPADKLPAMKGGNRFVWDMRYPGYKTFPGMIYYASPNLGPKAVPGSYIARLTSNGQTVEQVFEIIKDPRVSATPEDLQAQIDFLIKVRDKVSEANQGIIDIRKVKDDLAYLKKKAGDKPANSDLNNAIKKFEDELTVIENNIHQTKNQSKQDPLNYGIKLNNRLAYLMVEQGQGDHRPTKQAEEVRVELSKKIDVELENLRAVLKSNADSIKMLAKDKNIEMVM